MRPAVFTRWSRMRKHISGAWSSFTCAEASVIYLVRSRKSLQKCRKHKNRVGKLNLKMKLLGIIINSKSATFDFGVVSSSPALGAERNKSILKRQKPKNGYSED